MVFVSENVFFGMRCAVPGYRDKSGREWLERLKSTSGLNFKSEEKIDAAAISSAPSKYQMILCFDPLMSALASFVFGRNHALD